jgi:parallel beta-helix repeat protein
MKQTMEPRTAGMPADSDRRETVLKARPSRPRRAVGWMGLVLGVLAVTVATAAPAAAQYRDAVPITKCPVTISQPGYYVVTTDLVGPARQDAIVIKASDVQLDFAGKALYGRRLKDGSTPLGPSDDGGVVGIRVIGTSRVKISNARVYSFQVGIQIQSTPAGKLGQNTVTACTVSYNGKGIVLDTAAGNTIVGNTVSNNILFGNHIGFGVGSGIYLVNATGNTVTANSASNNIFGIWLSYASGNSVTSNNVQSNDYGISLLDHCSGNLITDNVATRSRLTDLDADPSSAENGWERNQFVEDNETGFLFGPRFGVIR